MSYFTAPLFPDRKNPWAKVVAFCVLSHLMRGDGEQSVCRSRRYRPGLGEAVAARCDEKVCDTFCVGMVFFFQPSSGRLPRTSEKMTSLFNCFCVFGQPSISNRRSKVFEDAGFPPCQRLKGRLKPSRCIHESNERRAPPVTDWPATLSPVC